MSGAGADCGAGVRSGVDGAGGGGVRGATGSGVAAAVAADAVGRRSGTALAGVGRPAAVRWTVGPPATGSDDDGDDEAGAAGAGAGAEEPGEGSGEAVVGKGVGVDAATVGAVPVTAGGSVVTVGAVVVTVGAVAVTVGGATGATGATARWTGGSVRPPVSGAFEAGAGGGVIGVVSEGGVERGAPRGERRWTGADGDGAEGPWGAGGTGACGAVEGSALGRTASAGLAVVGAPRPGRRVALRCTGRVVAGVGVVPGRVGVAGAEGPGDPDRSGDPDGLVGVVAERRSGADAGAGFPAGGCGCGVPRARCTGGRVVPDGIDVFVARWTGGTAWEGWAGCAVWGAVGLPGAAALRWTGGCWVPVGVLGRAAGSGCRFAGGGVGEGRWAAVGPSPVPVGRAAEGVPVRPPLGAGLTGPTARWTGGAGAAGAGAVGVGRVTARWTGVPLGAVRSGADGVRSVAPEGWSCGAVLRWAGVPGAVPPLAGVDSGEGDAVGVGVGVVDAVPLVLGVGLAGVEEARRSEPPVAPRSARDAGTARCTGRSTAPLGALPDRGTARCTGVCGAASVPGADGASPPGREAPEPESAREGASVRGCCSGTARRPGEPVVVGSGAVADRRSPGSAAPAPRAGSGRVAGAGPDRGTARWTGVPDAVPPPDGEVVPWAGVGGVPVGEPLPAAGAGRFGRGDAARWTGGAPDAVPPPDGEEAPWAGVAAEVGLAGPAEVVGGVAAGAVGVPAGAPLPAAGAGRFGRGDAARWTGVPEEAPPVGAGEMGLPEARVACCTGGAGGRPGVPDAVLSGDGEDELRTGGLEAAAAPEEAGGRGTERWTGGPAGVSVAAGACCCGRTARCTGEGGDAGGAAGGVAATSPPEAPRPGAGAAGPAGAEPGSARSPALDDEGAVPEDFVGASAVRRVEGRARRCTAGDPDGALVSGCRGRGGAGGTGVTRTPRAACGEGFTGAADDVDDADPVERDRWTGVAGTAGAGDDGTGPPPRALGAAAAPPLAPGRADGPADAPARAPGTAGPADRVPGA
ncbi:hypothetical protein ACIGW1_15500 [Streptomyces sp. NPDC053780]|uniref:hypothetical protein n=1 Tax=unclassified Streptomyces TaxID=2593676 RepID=UPI0034426C0C